MSPTLSGSELPIRDTSLSDLTAVLRRGSLSAERYRFDPHGQREALPRLRFKQCATRAIEGFWSAFQVVRERSQGNPPLGPLELPGATFGKEASRIGEQALLATNFEEGLLALQHGLRTAFAAVARWWCETKLASQPRPDGGSGGELDRQILEELRELVSQGVAWRAQDVPSLIENGMFVAIDTLCRVAAFLPSAYRSRHGKDIDRTTYRALCERFLDVQRQMAVSRFELVTAFVEMLGGGEEFALDVQHHTGGDGLVPRAALLQRMSTVAAALPPRATSDPFTSCPAMLARDQSVPERGSSVLHALQTVLLATLDRYHFPRFR